MPKVTDRRVSDLCRRMLDSLERAKKALERRHATPQLGGVIELLREVRDDELTPQSDALFEAVRDALKGQG